MWQVWSPVEATSPLVQDYNSWNQIDKLSAFQHKSQNTCLAGRPEIVCLRSGLNCQPGTLQVECKEVTVPCITEPSHVFHLKIWFFCRLQGKVCKWTKLIIGVWWRNLKYLVTTQISAGYAARVLTKVIQRLLRRQVVSADI